MKLFKSLRLPSAALAAAMLLSSLLALPASADDGGTTATTSLKITGDATLTEGSTGTASVVIENADQVYGIDTYVTIPSNVTVTQIGIKSAFNEDSGFDVTLANNQIHIVGAGSIDRTDTSPVYGSVADELVNYDGTICTFEYTTTVKASDTPNTINFAFPSDTKVRFCTSGEEEVTVTTSGLTVTVEAAVTEPVYNSSVAITAKNALFKSDYSLMYAIPESTPEGWYIVVEQEQYNDNTLLDEKQKTILTAADNYGFQTISGVKCYVVLVKGISARCVANKITATLYQKVDGVMSYGDPLEYNLVTYATNKINVSNPTDKQSKLKDAMIAFLNYASATQERFGYNTSNLANASLEDSQKSYDCETAITNNRNDSSVVIENPTAEIKAYAPQYKDKITLCVLLNTPEDRSDLYLKVEYTSVDGTSKSEKVALSEASLSKYSDGNYYPQVNYSNMAFKDVRSLVSLTVVDSNDVAISNTGVYSFESYAASRTSNKPDYNPARALINFGDKIKLYSLS